MDMLQVTIGPLGVAGTGVFGTSYTLVVTVIVLILVLRADTLRPKWVM
ncbi:MULTISPECIES: hypothetical protein [unclassified Bradyrhizobium]|nr:MULTISPECIES: hypothetical protein [unclassified Bradyrhizobium]